MSPTKEDTVPRSHVDSEHTDGHNTLTIPYRARHFEDHISSSTKDVHSIPGIISSHSGYNSTISGASSSVAGSFNRPGIGRGVGIPSSSNNVIEGPNAGVRGHRRVGKQTKHKGVHKRSKTID